MPYKNFVLSLNCTEDEKNVIDEAVKLASILQAEITVIHINDPAAGKIHMLMDSMPLVTDKEIRELFRKFGHAKEAKTIHIRLIESEFYSREIALATRDADLLIMGHHPKNAFLAALTDSTDERVADMISCPMLIVPLH